MRDWIHIFHCRNTYSPTETDVNILYLLQKKLKIINKYGWKKKNDQHDQQFYLNLHQFIIFFHHFILVSYVFICARDYTDTCYLQILFWALLSPLVKNFKTNKNQSTMWQNVGHTSPYSKLFQTLKFTKKMSEIHKVTDKTRSHWFVDRSISFCLPGSWVVMSCYL